MLILTALIGCGLVIVFAIGIGGVIAYALKSNNKNQTMHSELQQADYFMQTHNSYYQVMSDAGKRGEFQISQLIDHLIGYKRILYNCYIPKPDGGTTEVDIILIHETGIYVIESKNYKGWIFGSESDTYWTQTLYKKNANGANGVQKNRFYNPVIQNEGHIKWLKQYLNMPDLPVFSYIVFGSNTTFKNVMVNSPELYVVAQQDALPAIIYNANNMGRVFSNEFIEQLYLRLFPLTQVSEMQKMEHVNRVRK